jgi:hypothetical protein
VCIVIPPFPLLYRHSDHQAPAWEPHGEFKLSVTVLGAGMEACRDGPANGLGITADTGTPAGAAVSTDAGSGSGSGSGSGGGSGTGQPSATGSAWRGSIASENVYSERDGACTLHWRCSNDCSLDPTLLPTTLRVRSTPRSWANYVAYTLQLPAFTPDATRAASSADSPFVISNAFYAPGSSRQNMTLLRGAAATTVKLYLTPYVKATAASDVTGVAFLPSLLGTQFGSAMAASAFTFNDTSGFAIDFVLTRNTLSMVLYVHVCASSHLCVGLHGRIACLPRDMPLISPPRSISSSSLTARNPTRR